MVEVFILGVLVSLVKLSHLADVLLGPAIWCFGGLMLLLAALASLLDAHTLWQAWEGAERFARALERYRAGEGHAGGK